MRSQRKRADIYRSNIRRMALVATLVAACLVVGCGGGASGKGEGVIVRYPGWNYEKYERVAVLPFRTSKPKAREAAAQAYYMVRDNLSQNGAFTVIAVDTLKDVLTEQDLSRLAEVADPKTVIPAGKIQSAQAIIVGEITDFDLDAQRSEKRRPVYARDKQGRLARDRYGQPIVVREEVTPVYRASARVAATIRVIDTATMETLYSYSAPAVERDAESRNTQPRETPDDLAVEAAKEVAQDLYLNIAPIRINVELDSDMFLVALDYYDGQYDENDTILTTQKEFLVAVRNLPKACERNKFRVAVAPLEGRNFWEEEFTWSGNNPVRGVSFSVPVSKLIEAGGTEFVAKLYSVGDEEPLLTYDITLEPPAEGAPAAKSDAAEKSAEKGDSKSAEKQD